MGRVSPLGAEAATAIELLMCWSCVGEGVFLSRVAVVGGGLDNSIALNSTIFW